MTPEPTVRAETANNSDDPPADGIQGNHADQQECEHHQRGAALAVAVSPCDHHCNNADENRNGEEHSAGLGEPKPVTERSPIASEPRHVRSLGQRNDGTGSVPVYDRVRVLRIGSIVLRVDDLRRQTEFWQSALGYVRRDDGESDDFVLLGPPDGVGAHLSLDQVRSTLQIPPRLHLDLYTDDQAG